MKINQGKHIFRSEKYKSACAEALDFIEKIPLYSFPLTSPFPGVGVYILYYFGDFIYYRGLVNKQKNSSPVPFYVGKAVPPGWRTARINVSTSSSLYNRLREHSRSIEQASNLSLQDFQYRMMILVGTESDLIVPVEAELIRKYRPVWNMIIDGFGNHNPGAGRYDQAKSEWDILHPGRDWANRLKGKSPLLENIVIKIKKYTESA